MTGRKVRAPKTIAVPDHNVPTTLDRANAATMTEDSRIQVERWTRTPAISASTITRCPMSVRASCTSSAPNRAGPCPA